LGLVIEEHQMFSHGSQTKNKYFEIFYLNNFSVSWNRNVSSLVKPAYMYKLNFFLEIYKELTFMIANQSLYVNKVYKNILFTYYKIMSSISIY